MKVLTLNTWQERGPWQLRWNVILEGLAEHRPEVVVFQEVFNYEWAQEVKRKAGYDYLVFHPEPSGLMILSRYPINHSDCLTLKTQSPTEDYLRYALFAELNIGHKQSLGFFNTHLSWKLDEGNLRQEQVVELVDFIENKAGHLDVIVTGDFNAVPQSVEVQKMILEGRMTDLYGLLHPDDEGLTWNNDNPYTRNSNHPMPDRRIDYIFFRRPKGILPEPKSISLLFDRPNHSGIWASDHI